MKKIVVAVVACWCVALTGCGDDSSKDSSKDSSDDKTAEASDGSLSKAELIEQGDAICLESNTRIEKIGEGFADPDNPTQEEFTAAVQETMVPEIEGQITDLRKLVPPAEDADLITGMLGALEVALADVKDDPTVLTTGDVFAPANEIAKKYGFKECGKG